MASIHFLGAAGTVTGSRFLLKHQDQRVLIDCDLFQGRKELRQRNWRALPVPPRSIGASEPSALQALEGRVEARGWPAYIPEHLEKVELAE